MRKKLGFLFISILLLSSTPLLTNPQEGVVAAGDVQITTAKKTVDVHQTTDKAIINWNSFNIHAGETTTFHQPSTSSITLNRINAINGASTISGKLNANGQVWLINSAGVLFGPSAQVNVGGLLATTAQIRDQDFLSGHYQFYADGAYPAAAIVNEGKIQVQPGGLAALIGHGVENKGLVEAKLGTVLLGSAQAYTLDFDGDHLIQFIIDKPAQGLAKNARGETLSANVVQSGTINVGSDQKVVLTEGNAHAIVNHAINMTQVSEATHVSMEGGVIVLSAVEGSIEASHTVKAPGGIVSIQGQDIRLDNIHLTTGDDVVGGMININGTQWVSIDNGSLQSNSGTVGGAIQILGKGDIQLTKTRVEAEGDVGGGSIVLGKEGYMTSLDEDSLLSVDARQSGAGGNITVTANEVLNLGGQLSSKGEEAGVGSVTLQGKAGIILANSVTIDVAANKTESLIQGVISGSGALIKQGSGTLSIFGNQNTYTGGTVVGKGTLSVETIRGSLGSGTLTVAKGAVVIERSAPPVVTPAPVAPVVTPSPVLPEVAPAPVPVLAVVTPPLPTPIPFVAAPVPSSATILPASEPPTIAQALLPKIAVIDPFILETQPVMPSLMTIHTTLLLPILYSPLYIHHSGGYTGVKQKELF